MDSEEQRKKRRKMNSASQKCGISLSALVGVMGVPGEGVEINLGK